MTSSSASSVGASSRCLSNSFHRGQGRHRSEPCDQFGQCVKKGIYVLVGVLVTQRYPQTPLGQVGAEADRQQHVGWLKRRR